MVILVDLDDVLINTGVEWVALLNERYGTHVNYDDITRWDIEKFFPSLTHDQVFSPLLNGDVWPRVTPISGASATLTRLIDDGHEVFIVTASSINTIGKKWRSVIKKFFPIIKEDHVIVSRRKDLIRGDVLIDDASHNFDGNHSYYGILFDTPHNRDYRGTINKFARANNWHDVYNIINSISCNTL